MYSNIPSAEPTADPTIEPTTQKPSTAPSASPTIEMAPIVVEIPTIASPNESPTVVLVTESTPMNESTLTDETDGKSLSIFGMDLNLHVAIIVGGIIVLCCCCGLLIAWCLKARSKTKRTTDTKPKRTRQRSAHALFDQHPALASPDMVEYSMQSGSPSDVSYDSERQPFKRDEEKACKFICVDPYHYVQCLFVL